MSAHHEERMRALLQEGSHDKVISFYDSCISQLGNRLSILDLGAGSGLVARSLAEKAYTNTLVAYDRTLDCMRQMTEHPKISKEVGEDVDHLPFADGRFDVVVCRYAFHHFEHKSAALKEIARVSRPNGLLLYSDPVLPEHSKTVLNPLYCVREDSFHGYLGYFDTIELLEKHGFQIVLSRPYKIRYSDFEKYLNGVDDGFSNRPPEGFGEALKAKLRRAWNTLDQKTRTELGMDTTDLSSGFAYHVVDLAATRQSE